MHSHDDGRLASHAFWCHTCRLFHKGEAASPTPRPILLGVNVKQFGADLAMCETITLCMLVEIAVFQQSCTNALSHECLEAN